MMVLVILHLFRPLEVATQSLLRKHVGCCHVMAERPTIQLIIPTRGLPFGIHSRHARQDERPVLAFCTVNHAVCFFGGVLSWCDGGLSILETFFGGARSSKSLSSSES